MRKSTLYSLALAALILISSMPLLSSCQEEEETVEMQESVEMERYAYVSLDSRPSDEWLESGVIVMNTAEEWAAFTEQFPDASNFVSKDSVAKGKTVLARVAMEPYDFTKRTVMVVRNTNVDLSQIYTSGQKTDFEHMTNYTLMIEYTLSEKQLAENPRWEILLCLLPETIKDSETFSTTMQLH